MENVTDFNLPLHISNENRYAICFENKVNYYIAKFKELLEVERLYKYKDLINKSIISMEKSKSEILSCLDLYLHGKEEEARKKIAFIIGENSSAILFNLIDSNAFAGNILYRGDKKIDNLYLYRGRIGDAYQTFDAKDMLHIPLNMRSKVDSFRYSVLGIPCVYLASNSYTVWKEMKCPTLNELSISAVKIDDPMVLYSKVIDLSLPIESYYEIFIDEKSGIENNEDVAKVIIDCFKAVPFIISCSVVCDSSAERKFKIEYVLPQFLMRFQADNLIGVAYRSNRIDGNVSSFACNLAIPVLNYDNGKKFGKIIESVTISDSMNIGYFKDFIENNSSLTAINYDAKGPSSSKMHQMFSLKYSDAESTFNVVNRGRRFSFDGTIIYQDSVFYKFDEYLLFKNELKALKNEEI